MHLQRVRIVNVRSIRELDWEFGVGAGWHVVLGNNGSGKSSVLRAIALGLLDRDHGSSWALSSRWCRKGAPLGRIDLNLAGIEVGREFHRNGVVYDPWPANIPFSCGYGPFRRLAKSRYAERIEALPTEVARHASLFDNNEVLMDALDWLIDLDHRALKQPGNGASALLEQIRRFINETDFLPYDAKLRDISPDAVVFEDGNGVELAIEELSDGYRSILGMTFDLIRRMTEHYGPEAIWTHESPPRIAAEGIVLIDEVDAHLHPAWQRRIGGWLTAWFPNVQFIVSTHSPLICQAAERGSILKLAEPGQDGIARVVLGLERERLLYGNVLDAYGTDSFDHVATRSEAGRAKLERLAMLNQKALQQGLDGEESAEREQLLRILPTRREGAA